eukprot:402783-Prorocentrum_minimum.AAC.3
MSTRRLRFSECMLMHSLPEDNYRTCKEGHGIFDDQIVDREVARSQQVEKATHSVQQRVVGSVTAANGCQGYSGCKRHLRRIVLTLGETLPAMAPVVRTPAMRMSLAHGRKSLGASGPRCQIAPAPIVPRAPSLRAHRLSVFPGVSLPCKTRNVQVGYTEREVHRTVLRIDERIQQLWNHAAEACDKGMVWLGVSTVRAVRAVQIVPQRLAERLEQVGEIRLSSCSMLARATFGRHHPPDTGRVLRHQAGVPLSVSHHYIAMVNPFLHVVRPWMHTKDSS